MGYGGGLVEDGEVGGWGLGTKPPPASQKTKYPHVTSRNNKKRLQLGTTGDSRKENAKLRERATLHMHVYTRNLNWSDIGGVQKHPNNFHEHSHRVKGISPSNLAELFDDVWSRDLRGFQKS